MAGEFWITKVNASEGWAKGTTWEDSARPFFVQDLEYPFQEDLITDASGNIDTQLSMLAKVYSVVDVLYLGGSYELMQRIWPH